MTCHFFLDWFKFILSQILLQITSCHVFHHDANCIVDSKLLLKADHIGAVLATLLELDFARDLHLAIAVKLIYRNHLDCKVLF